MTKEHFERLKEVEQYLYTCMKAGYKRNTTRKENDIVFDIYDELTGRKNNRNYSCAKCVFDAFSWVAKRYYDYKAETTDVVQAETEPEADNQEVKLKRSQTRKIKKITNGKKRNTKEGRDKVVEQV